MKKVALVAFSLLITLVAAAHFAYAKPKTEKVKVTVLSEVPNTRTYDWAITGSSTTSCGTDSCVTSYSPPSAGTNAVTGATIYLQQVDNSIVVAKCSMKVAVGRSLAIGMLAGMNGQTASNVQRDCRVPNIGVIDAEFTGTNVKLYFPDPTAFIGHVKIIHETYEITGRLEPSELATSVASEQSAVAQAATDPLVNDAITRYSITKRDGTAKDRCVQAKAVVAACLEAKDEANYIVWKAIQNQDCVAAGITE